MLQMGVFDSCTVSHGLIYRSDNCILQMNWLPKNVSSDNHIYRNSKHIILEISHISKYSDLHLSLLLTL